MIVLAMLGWQLRVGSLSTRRRRHSKLRLCLVVLIQSRACTPGLIFIVAIHFRSHGKTPNLILPTSRLFNRLDDYFFRLYAGQICNRQVSDRFTPPGLCLGVDQNFGDLYCYARSRAINNCDLFFFCQTSPRSQSLKG